MALKLKTAPAVEPISLATVKLHLRLDSGSLADNITTLQSITPGAHVIATAYSLVGTGADVLGYRALVNLNTGTCGAGGSIAAKIQESDTDVSANYTDWTGGAFTTVTTGNAIQEEEYTGNKQYIRVVATVAGATCDFGADVIREQPYSAEDSLLTALITAAREYAEGFQNRAYITQTWYLWLDSFPSKNYIDIPLPPLQASPAPIVTYYDVDDAPATFAATSYFVDTISEPGRIVLNYGESWPSIILRPANGVCIEFVAGYGAAATSVPQVVRQAMLLLIGHWFESREAVLTGAISKEVEFAVKALLWLERVCTF